jgi:hypothetical protein
MDDDNWRIEESLDKAHEQEPRRAYRGPRNPTEYNEAARERLALKFALVEYQGSTETASQDEAVRVFGFWRPGDRS